MSDWRWVEVDGRMRLRDEFDSDVIVVAVNGSLLVEPGDANAIMLSPRLAAALERACIRLAMRAQDDIDNDVAALGFELVAKARVGS